MPKLHIVQVIPRLPPPVCGVADYSLNLARALRAGHGIDSSFISSQPLAENTASTGEFQTSSLPSHSIAAFRSALAKHSAADGILLQYSGYGFARRGAPLWLALAVRRLRKEKRLPPLHVMFHELWIRGAVTTSSFWNCFVQRWIIQQLCGAASTVITNREVFATMISSFRRPGQTPVQILQVTSGFGEPASLPEFTSRPPHMAFFGWPMPAEKAALLVPRLKAAIRQTGATRLVVFRHPLPRDIDLGIQVESHGILPAGEISARLLNCRYAFSDYWPESLGKSSLFAAYCAHGLATVLHKGQGDLGDGLRVGTQLLPLLSSDRSASIHEAEAVASAANEWYQGHDLAITASIFAGNMASAATFR